MMNLFTMLNRRRLVEEFKRLNRDERGAEGIEMLLIIVAVALPLLGLLIYFRKEINTWLKDIWEKRVGEGTEDFEPIDTVEMQ
ncbi:MAG: hypothetical protein QGD94_01855 [Planctomycetia bacterium]|nr:hypothetical protein [Planctomycetia bacterium]